ncbi:MAG: dockerin type I domain-containing protein, partial [Oscillospiraceae bacterium]
MKFGSLKRFAAAFLALTLVLTFAPPHPAAGESAITVQDPSAVPLEADPAIKQVTVQNAAIVAGKTYLLFLVPAGTSVPETAPERSAAILGNLLAVKQEVATAGTVTFQQVRAKTAVPVDAYLSGEGFAVPHQLTVAESGELLGSGSISGTATAAHLQDFSASTVTLIDGETGYRYGETTKLLSADGKFDFTAIAPGNYGVEVNAPGYVPVRSVFVQPLKNGETYTLAAVDLNPGTGDVNNDDVFSSQDVKTLSSYLANPEKPAEGNYPDVNGDTKIDTADLAVVISRLKPTAGTIAPTVSVTGSAATATVNKLTVSMNGDVAATEKKPAVTAPKVDAAAFTIGYDAAVIVPCKPDGTAIGSPA